jgi:hypothetical protein
MFRLAKIDDENATEDEIKLMLLVEEVANKCGASVNSKEAEEFFNSFLEKYSGDIANLKSWLVEEITPYFIALTKRPNWIQSPEWPFENGKPMIFAGQLDLPVRDGIISQFYHDDASLYIFIGELGPVVITQIY